MSTDPDRPVRTIALTRGVKVFAVATVLAAAVGGAALSIPVRAWTTDADWESPEQAEGAVHAAVTRMADEGLLAEGDTFRVVEIRGTVGPHNSPWHITYTAEIEKTGPDE